MRLLTAGLLFLIAAIFPLSMAAQDEQEWVTSLLSENAAEHLPKAEEGEVQVVVVGEYKYRSLPIVIHNNSEEAQSVRTLTLTALDADGNSPDGEWTSTPVPNVLGPGEYGVAYFTSIEDYEDMELTFEMHLTPLAPQMAMTFTTNLTVTNVTLEENSFTATVMNQTDDVVEPTEVYGVCLNDDAEIVGVMQWSNAPKPLEPGASVDLSANLLSVSADDCTHWIAAAYAYM